MSKRDDIIGAAVLEFGEHSYDTASVNRIIKNSGTSKGTFYHYFKDKKGLYFTIIEQMIQIKQSYFTRMMESIRAENSDFFDLMKAQAKAGTAFMREHPELYRFGSQFAKDSGAVREEFEKKYLPEVGASLAKVVKLGFDARNPPGEFPMDFITRVISFTMTHYYDILFDENETPEPEEIEKRLDLLFEFLRKGFS